MAAAKDVDASQLKFVYSGKVLQDEKTLQDYKMKDGDSVIYMVSNKKAVTAAPAATPAAPVIPAAPVAAPEPEQASQNTNVETEASEAPATSAPAAASEQPASAASASSDFVVGEEREQAIQYMLELGFPRLDIEAAMREAYNNPQRAVEYLLSGVPLGNRAEGNRSSPEHNTSSTEAPAAGAVTGAALGAAAADFEAEGDDSEPHGNMFDAAAAIDRGTAGGAESGRLDNELALLNEAITSNPELLQPLLQRLAATNPQIAQLIAQDPDGFVQRLMDNDFEIEEEGAELESGEGIEGAITLDLTEQDQDAINRLCEMGFERNWVIQIYMACDKNEEVAADILFRDN